MAAWTSGRHFGAREQVLHLLAYFGVTPARIEPEAVIRTARAIEDAARLAPPNLLPGAREAVPALAAAGYRLGLISDTSLTPGRVLRHFLEQDGLAEYFAALTFSDETGFPKPDPRMFELTLARLGTQPDPPPLAHEAVHIGDTPRTDIAGAQALGMLTVRYAAVNDHCEPPAADFVIRDHRELLPLLTKLTGGD
jgi:FMN phosphatase YigB (HAD superfamily)